jgi:hypothetical protein
MSLDARQFAYVSMLPELPAALIFHAVNVIMGYPVGILVEDGIVEVFQLEFIIGVDNRLYLIMLLYDSQPSQDRGLELLV